MSSDKPAGTEVDQGFNGCSSILHLFALCVRRALARMGTLEVARLTALPAGAIDALGWLQPSQVDALRELLGVWAARDRGSRYSLRAKQRDRLVEEMGHGHLGDCRSLITLMALIAEQFTTLPDDLEHPAVAAASRQSGVVPIVAPFLDGVSNPPPPIGKMTAAVVLRGWAGTLWVSGRLDRLDFLGVVPALSRRPLPERTRQTLERALDQDQLRMASVSWRDHEGFTMAGDCPQGTFACLAPKPELPMAALDSVLDALTEAKIHLAVLPELMLAPSDLDKVKRALRDRARRFPALVVIGLGHQKAANGSSYDNVAVVLTSAGDEIHRHEKLEPFTHDELGVEAIVPRSSTDYGYIDTPLGRLVVNVCRDIGSDVPLVLNRGIEAGVLAVPAYSKRLDFAAAEARALGARQRAITMAVNPLRWGPDSGPRHAAHLYVPVRSENASVTSDVASADTILAADLVGPTAYVHAWCVARGRVGRRTTILTRNV